MDDLFSPAFAYVSDMDLGGGVASERSLNLVSGFPFAVVNFGSGGSVWGPCHPPSPHKQHLWAYIVSDRAQWSAVAVPDASHDTSDS